MTFENPKARLLPLYLRSADDPDFVAHVQMLAEQLGEVATLLPPRQLGPPIEGTGAGLDAGTGTVLDAGTGAGPEAVADADAVVFPVLTGDIYRNIPAMRAIELPVLILTSDFATMAMWDWEIISYLRAEGIDVLAPYSLDVCLATCRALAAKRRLRQSKFIVYQDEPGKAGKQPAIFRRFYWWEDECTQRISVKFGLRIDKRSFRELGARARAVRDDAVEQRRQAESRDFDGLSVGAGLSALKLYQAVRDDLDSESDVAAIGINCLNESEYSDTTPCLAWDLLFQERELIWGCEADTLSMLTKYLLFNTLRAPVMMTNLYPFLMGQAALQHERIPSFPEVDEPANYVLAAHCGYLGVLPRPFAQQWRLRPRALEIVDPNAVAIDAQLPTGALTLAKLSPDVSTIVIVEGELAGYVGYPGSDCRNGALIHVPDGHALMDGLPSHHSILVTGHHLAAVKAVGEIFGLAVQTLA
ncbi:MAG TPA: hypothetical protein VL984_12700 [Acidimicrobiales bacterium]|nr:hypothetical protein [Acidimicrobiales bacterium]